VGVVAFASAQALSASTGSSITVSPKSGHPSTAFTVSFKAPQRSGAVDGTERSYEVGIENEAIGNTSGCDSAFSTAVPVNAAGVARIKVAPKGRWCSGTYNGRVNEEIRAICKPGQACPEYVALRPLGQFVFTVKPVGGCARPTVSLPAREGTYLRGPTGVVAGLYIQGGAIVLGCPQRAHGPYAGSISATSTVAGVRTVITIFLKRDRRLFHLRLRPGVYTLSGAVAGSGRARPQRITIRAGHSLRQDLFVDVP
jgi:hypothetical protein